MSRHLSKEAWSVIEHAYRGGEQAKQLARRFGIAPQTIRARSSRERWREADSRTLTVDAPIIERLEALTCRLENVSRMLLTRRKK